MGKKIPFMEVIKRITGISTAVFGISWEPPELERDIARRLLTFLEDQRLLLGNYQFLRGHPNYVENALYQLRNRLTEELETLDQSSPLAKLISSMRAACRKCLDSIQMSSPRSYRHHGDDYYYPIDPIGWATIGELRATFGLHIAQLCVRYGLDIEEELKSILPPLDTEDAESR